MELVVNVVVTTDGDVTLPVREFGTVIEPAVRLFVTIAEFEVNRPDNVMVAALMNADATRFTVLICPIKLLAVFAVIRSELACRDPAVQP